MSPLELNLWILVGVTVACWLMSVATREYSWVDRIWSVAPVAYVWVFVSLNWNTRSVVLAVLVTAWGARLTFNFARRGGYGRGGEDYRWAVLRERMRPWQFQLFNLGFIASYQNALLLAITLPALPVAESGRAWGTADVALTVLFLGFLVGETVADQQRWRFHRAGAPGGVLRTALYRYSRHPNYFFEIAQWFAVFGFAAVAAGTQAWWSAAGALLLTGLFIGSTVFTESISRSRHPEYNAYRHATSMLVPWPPHRP